jgi:predicted naringenin-chalcone synthase
MTVRTEARIEAVGTAMPAYVFKQAEIVEEFFARQPGWDPAWAEVFEASGVERRASVIGPSFYQARAAAPTTAERMRAFAPAARRLGAEAVRRALDRAGPGAEVADLLAVSCTGYSGPGLDVHLADDLGLDRRVRRLAVGHMGCYAALPALRTAAALVAASGGRAVIACVELCTLHLQPATSREQAVSQSLFGDGAAAAVVGPGGAGPAVVDARAVTVPASQHRMGWLVEDDGFHMSLSPRVPALVERAVGPLVAELLAANGLRAGEVDHWAVHPGGPEILDRVQRRLGLTEGRLAASWEALADGGNRSSATILFILEGLLAAGEVRPGQWLVALAFGTGLTLEALLLRG